MTRRDVVDVADLRKEYDLNRFTSEQWRYLLCLVLELFINTQTEV